jgi:hypothetical protein
VEKVKEAELGPHANRERERDKEGQKKGQTAKISKSNSNFQLQAKLTTNKTTSVD